MGEAIHFYGTTEEYGCFSNVAFYQIRLGGRVWPTSEPFFQAQKFEDREQQEAIRKASRPRSRHGWGGTGKRRCGGTGKRSRSA